MRIVVKLNRKLHCDSVKFTVTESEQRCDHHQELSPFEGKDNSEYCSTPFRDQNSNNVYTIFRFSQSGLDFWHKDEMITSTGTRNRGKERKLVLTFSCFFFLKLALTFSCFLFFTPHFELHTPKTHTGCYCVFMHSILHHKCMIS